MSALVEQFRRPLRVVALTFAAAIFLAGCGDGNGPALSGTGTSFLDEPTGGPSDDESELTPPDETEAEQEIESQPPPPPAVPTPGVANEVRELCFSPKTDCMNRLLSYLQAETQAIDMAIYHLYDSRFSRVLVEKHQAGIPVRVLADRHAYTIKHQHKRELDFLASRGVPVRTNRFRGIIHHKMTILHGLGLVEQGSMNYTSIASRKVFNSRTGRVEWNEEMAFFTSNPQVFARYRERFDRAWQNTGEAREPYMVFRAGMDLPTFVETEQRRPVTCYENPSPDPRPLPDHPELRVCFAGDEHCNRDIVGPLVRAETERVDVIAFRLTVGSVVDPILSKARAGLPVRVLFERSQYGSPAYPSMKRFLDDLHELRLAGRNVQIRATAHPGFMHMKSVITSTAATWGSGNYTTTSSKRIRGCQSTYYQTEDMMIARDPALVAGMRGRFDEMWDSPDFADWEPGIDETVGEVPEE